MPSKVSQQICKGILDLFVLFRSLYIPKRANVCVCVCVLASAQLHEELCKLSGLGIRCCSDESFKAA